MANAETVQLFLFIYLFYDYFIVSPYLLCHVDSLCFVVPWHFQVVLVKIALNFVMCSLYIVFLAMFFFVCTLMKSPTEDSKRRFSELFRSALL